MGMRGYSVVAFGIPEVLIKDLEIEDLYDYEKGELKYVWGEGSDSYIAIVVDEDRSDQAIDGVEVRFSNIISINMYIDKFLSEFKKYFKKDITRDDVGLITGNFWR